MLTLGLKLYIYLDHDFLWISSCWEMEIEENGILVCCKHALSSFSEAKGEMTREFSGWIITGEKAQFAWFVAWELAWAEAAEIYLKCNQFLYLRIRQESKWSNIFLMEHFSTGKVLWFENITFYGKIFLSAILLIQHGTLSMTDLARLLSQQLPRRLALLFGFGGFQGSAISGLTDSKTLIPAQQF